MKICQALLWATEKLKEPRITSAELDAEVVLAYVTQKPRAWLLGNPKSEILNPKQIQNSKLLKFQTLINRRTRGVPVAYLTHHKEFYGLDFYVDKRVLVPRPESELLVDGVLELLQGKSNTDHRPLTIIDIGAGSGCIAIALAKNLMPYALSLMPRIYATDISQDALAVARKNAQKHDVKIKFLHGDLLEPIIKRKINPDIIVANLPYLKPSQIKGDILHEPRGALDGGDDGLRYYERLLEQIKKNLLFINYYLLFEIDPSQTKKVGQLIKKYFSNSKIEVKKDLAGRERVAVTTIHEAHNTRRLNRAM